eukprot:scaffold482852_cov46-Prasinocladus_malaysianus.AAC.1
MRQSGIVSRLCQKPSHSICLERAYQECKRDEHVVQQQERGPRGCGVVRESHGQLGRCRVVQQQPRQAERYWAQHSHVQAVMVLESNPLLQEAQHGWQNRLHRGGKIGEAPLVRLQRDSYGTVSRVCDLPPREGR